MKRKLVFPIGIFLLALCVRLVFNKFFFSPWVSDEPSLFSYATNVMNGLYYGTEGVYWPPGYIFFTGFLFKIFGQPEIPYIVSIKIIQSILGALTAALIYGITMKLFKQYSIAITAGILYAVYPPAILYTGMFISETLWIFVLFSGILCAQIAVEEKSSKLLVVTGIIFGIASLIRTVALPFGVLIGFLLLFHEKKISVNWGKAVKGTGIVLLFMFLTILPWTIRNYIVVGEFVFIDVNAGINLYLAHNEKSTGQWVNMGPDDPIIQLRDHPDVDKEGKRRAFEYIVNNPVRTLEKAIQVNHLFWTKENSDVQRFASNWVKNLYTVFSFRLLAIISVLGIILSRQYWHDTSWLVLYIAAYNLLIAFLYFAPRYRFAIEPLLILFAAFTINLLGKLLFKKYLFKSTS